VGNNTGQKANPKTERIFGVFENGQLAATARFTRHPDGNEMDCVFTLDEYRGRGYARLAVQALVDSCGAEKIYIHSTLVLISFYKTFGWVPIPEDMLPQSIRDRFIFLLRRDGGLQCLPYGPGGRATERPE
jgi:predicted GNAT family N-acyltransferase